MKEIEDKLTIISELSNPNTFIKSEIVKFEDVYYHYINDYDENLNIFFEELWSSKLDEYMIKLIDYCGYRWKSYVFELFYPYFQKYEIDYYTEKFISGSSKTIKEYFRKNRKEVFYPIFEKYPKTWKSVFQKLPPSPKDVSKDFFIDLSEYLEKKGIQKLFNKEVSIKLRTRRSKATGELFSDISNCGDIEVQNFQIYYSYTDFDVFRRLGTDEDVKQSIPNLRKLFDFLQFIPKEHSTCKSIYKNIGIEKYASFVNIAKHCYWPERYSDVYGNWLSAVKATGYLGEHPLIKGKFGYRTLAKDGHVCNSLAEKIIDDWLFDKSIPHEKEPSYPEEIRSFLHKNIRADWKIGKYYIEYFGLQSNEDYAKKTDSKILACNLFEVKLIKLYPGDEYRLDSIFNSFINKDNT